MDARQPQQVIQPPFRRGLSRTEAAGYIGVSPTTFDRMIAAGDMPNPKRVGLRKIGDVRALDLAFDALSGDALDLDTQNDWD